MTRQRQLGGPFRAVWVVCASAWHVAALFARQLILSQWPITDDMEQGARIKVQLNYHEIIGFGSPTHLHSKVIFAPSSL